MQPNVFVSLHKNECIFDKRTYGLEYCEDILFN